MKKNIKFRIIAMLLIVAVLAGISINGNAKKSEASSPVNVTRGNDEEEYANERYANACALAADIELQEVVRVENFERSDDSMVVTSYRADGSKIEAIYSELRIMKRYYNSNNENFFMEITDLDQYTDELMKMDFSDDDEYATSGDDKTDEFDEIEPSRDIVTRGKNGFMVYDWCTFKYRYQWRNNKKGLRIGCDAKYNINYSKLSADKKANCKEYTSAIYNSNKSIVLATAQAAAWIAGTYGVAVPIVVTVLDLLSQGLDKKTITNYVTKRFGKKLTIASAAGPIVGAVCAVITVKDFVSNRAKIKKYYRLIRKYGKKIS